MRISHAFGHGGLDKAVFELKAAFKFHWLCERRVHFEIWNFWIYTYKDRLTVSPFWLKTLGFVLDLSMLTLLDSVPTRDSTEAQAWRCDGIVVTKIGTRGFE